MQTTSPADHVPEFDATVITRLAAAGAVLLGKLNLTEGAMGGYHPEFPGRSLDRSSVDAGIMLQAIAGADRNDPTALPVPAMPAPLDRKGERLDGVRVGFDERYAVRDVDAQVSAAVVAAVEVLAGLGAEIVEVRLPDVDEYVAAWSVLCTAEAVAAHRATYPSRRDEYGAFFRGWLDRGARVSGAEYAAANNARAALTGHLRTAFEPIDALACPAMPDLPYPVTSEELRSSPPVVDEGLYRLQRFTVPFDLQRRADAHTAMRNEQRGAAACRCNWPRNRSPSRCCAGSAPPTKRPPSGIACIPTCRRSGSC